ncbi:hypothetical protein [Methylobacterium dankookense]|uniref:DUF4345 domain-containing protein n=1 Tax=Methylobacterium dankookense TaxID=560405 RepID=A0A564G4Z6_9HYPH|nr:hypothetical protein [Methylobacterium dankookense]GJD58163.1 hypothetical protein IFDJLNFL_4078 [Methylobacterium dankookense]VUF15114.1 hypothetical protein MTDSW087_04847 [Methylobacterium dankookense]
MRKPLLPMHPAGPYSTYRLFEWCMATMMVLMAFTLALPGDTMERAALKPIAEMGFSEPNMATAFASVGAVRICALFLNGFINNALVGPKGAYARAAGAGIGCLIMAQFTFALVYDALMVANAPSLNIAVFGTLAGFEALSVYIAVLDGVSRKSRLGRAVVDLERVLG